MELFATDEEHELRLLFLKELLADQKENPEWHDSEKMSERVLEPSLKYIVSERLSFRVARKAKNLGKKEGLILGVIIGAVGYPIIASLLSEFF